MKFPTKCHCAWERCHLHAVLEGPNPPLHEQGESCGYEVWIILRYAWYALVVQLVYAILAWSIHIENEYECHGKFILFVYLILSLGSVIEDLSIFDGYLPPAGPHAARIVINLLIATGLVGYSPFNRQENSTGLTAEDVTKIDELINLFGKWMAVGIFLLGQYLVNMAYFTVFRAIINLTIFLYMGLLKVVEIFYSTENEGEETDEIEMEE